MEISIHARGVIPTVSSPNWASMIMGAGPEQHGITSNDWSEFCPNEALSVWTQHPQYRWFSVSLASLQK